MEKTDMEQICQTILEQVDTLARSSQVTPQGLKHLSGVLKDIRDLRQKNEEGEAHLLALEKELMELAE